MKPNMHQGNDSNEAIGARLAAVRTLAFEQSKRAFAEGAELSEQSYGPVENGKRPLSLEMAKKLHKFYGLSLDFMYFGNMNDLPARIFTVLSSRPSVK